MVQKYNARLLFQDVVENILGRKYQDKEGNDRYTTEVVLQGYNSTLTMLGSASSSNASAIDNSSNNDSDSGNDFNSPSTDSANTDDDIPF